MSDHPRSIEWQGGLDGTVRLIDQTLLPQRVVMIECRDAATLRDAICRLAIRGAPAIGVAAAYGAVLGVRDVDSDDLDVFMSRLQQVCDELASARPTAVNLSWALQRMMRAARACPDRAALKPRLLAEAHAIRDEDARMCRAIGEHGAALIPDDGGVLTYCNAGALATSEFGTALAPMYVAHARGVRFRVYAPETRPLLQGARLTAWELSRAGIDVSVLCDAAAASLMRSGRVNLVITGADRIAANGDTANKVGTYAVACLAQRHAIPFFVAAPSSTFDRSLPDGSGIPIEERSADEVRNGFGRPTVPEAVACLNPAFDVTPAELIRGLITEKGIIHPVNTRRIREILG